MHEASSKDGEMNGELAEAIALVAHGNAWLADVGRARTDMADFESSNSTFQYVRSVRFEVKPQWLRASDVRSVADWVRRISRGRVSRLSLIAGGSKPVAFANEGTWGILGHGFEDVQAWYGTWTVNREGVDPTDLKPRIWEVAYKHQYRAGGVDPAPVDLQDRSAELRGALIEASEFARRDDFLTTFVSWFDEALNLGSSEDPTIVYHPDLLPNVGYTLDARRLVAMAARSWVFGGMGSWNDIGFSDTEMDRHYRTVSERLYRAVLDAIRDATNSFAATG